MATESLTTFNEFLRIMFLEGNLNMALANNILLYNWVFENSQVVTFRGAQDGRFPVKDQRQSGVGFVASGSSTLPTATTSNALNPQFNPRYTYGVFELDDMTLKIGTGDLAYEQAGDMVQGDVMLSMKQILNAAWYDDGRCRLAILPGADDQQTITALQPIHLLKGFRCDLIDATDDQTKLVDSLAVDAVDHQGVSGNLLRGTFTFSESAPSGSAANDYVVPEDAISASGDQYAPFGLRAGCTSANPALENYGGVDRSTSGNEAWQGNRIHNSGTNRTWDVARANAMVQLIRRRSGGVIKLADIVVLHNRNIAQEVFNSVAPDRQIVVRGREAMEVAPGFATGSQESFEPYAFLNGVNPMFQDEMAPANTEFYLSPRTWRLMHVSPPELVEEDGSVLHRFEGRPAWQGRWRYFNEFFNVSPPANGIQEDIAETNPA